MTSNMLETDNFFAPWDDPEPVIGKICPRCFIELPVTGECQECF